MVAPAVDATRDCRAAGDALRSDVGLRLVAPYADLAAGYDAALGRDNFERTRRAFERLVRRYGIRFRTVADLGAGTGLFARYLARSWGARVFAVDRSPQMLRQAARNAGTEPITLVRQDLRSLRLPMQVDLATANFDTVNHLLAAGDLQCMFRRVARAVRPGGHFIFDVITPCEPLGGRRTFSRLLCRGRRALLQRIAWDRHQHLLRIQVVIGRRDRPWASVEEHLERAWLPQHVSRWLQEAGFVIRGVYDAATIRPASRCAPRLLFVAERSAPDDTGNA